MLARGLTCRRLAAAACLLVCCLVGVSSARSLQAEPHPSEEHNIKQLVRVAHSTGYKTTEPIIGVLTQPCTDCPGRSYVGASYVKWVEAAGGRIVPIRFYASDAELYRLFKSINGLVFAGGLTWLWLDSPYVIAARKLFNWAKEANDNGDVFPIHGTCLGFQLLQILVSNVSRNDLLVETNSVAHPTTMDWTGAEAKSHVFGNLPADLHPKVSDPKLNIIMQNHEYGVPPAHYDRWPVLKEFYNVLSTSKDRNGSTYISTIEAKKYPFTGTQWHPEKPCCEFGMAEIPHTLDAVRVGGHFGNYFVDTARYSSHKPESLEQELQMLIYSTPPVFSARFESVAEDNYDGPYMTYYFDSKSKPPVGPDDDEHENSGTAVRSHGRDGAAPVAETWASIRAARKQSAKQLR